MTPEIPAMMYFQTHHVNLPFPRRVLYFSLAPSSFSTQVSITASLVAIIFSAHRGENQLPLLAPETPLFRDINQA